MASSSSSSSSSLVRDLLLKACSSLASKLGEADESALWTEVVRLESVPPAPNRPELQHDTMVAQGLCRQVGTGRGGVNRFWLPPPKKNGQKWA